MSQEQTRGIFIDLSSNLVRRGESARAQLRRRETEAPTSARTSEPARATAAAAPTPPAAPIAPAPQPEKLDLAALDNSAVRMSDKGRLLDIVV